MRIFSFLKLCAGLGLILLISSCGGESKDTSPPKRETTSVSGILFDAPIAGARVVLWEYANGAIGKKLGETRTSSKGDYSMEVNSGSMPVLLQAFGGAYTDPATGEVVYEGDGKTLKFESTAYFYENKANRIMLTPLSLISKGLADYKIHKLGMNAEGAIDSANSTISSMYGFDVITVEPIDIVKGGQSAYVTAGHQYGAYLTAYSVFSSDLIKKYPASDSSSIYTSFTLSDIMYRDISADGQLDGYETDNISGLDKKISFGKESVSVETYTNILSQYILITVNNNRLNVSGTNPNDYKPFASKVNKLGTTPETMTVFPPRTEVPIDDTEPMVERSDKDVLVRLDSLDLLVKDNVGTKSLRVSLQYQDDLGWSTEFACPEVGFGDGYCNINTDTFIEGARENKASILIDTIKLDAISETITDAKLVVYAEDIVGNENTTPYEIPFKWDNFAPVIEIESATTFNPSLGHDYLLEGFVKEDSSKMSEFTVSFNNGEPQPVTCHERPAEHGYECTFQESFGKELFSNALSKFSLIVTDENGNRSETIHNVLSDTTKPNQAILYPDTPMSFIQVVNNVRQDIIESYSSSSFSTIDLANKFLNIPFRYAKDGLLISHPTVDYENFDPTILNINKIPYIKVKVSDPIEGAVSGENLGTSADKLILRVNYKAAEDGQNPSGNNTVTSADSNTIPHETINFDENGYAKEVIYYIPYTKEIFGNDFRYAGENHIQEITLTTTDGSGNISSEQTISFRTTFNLPEIKVVTPFINATASFEVYADNGSTQLIATCTTEQKSLISDPNTMALDVAGCSINSEYIGEVIKVSLSSKLDSTIHNRWSRKDQQVAYLDSDSGFSAHVLVNEGQNVYITELAVYQSGFFDYLWEKEPNKSKEKAKEILAKVNKMLTEGDSFFGFNPILTAYATNEEIEAHTPSNPSLPYQHRYLLESLVILSDKSSIDDSVSFAKSFYDDFSFDGKPNGTGKNGGISLGSYDFSENTYRSDLANIYFKYLTDDLSISDSIALAYADNYATANPYLDGSALFSDSGSSIDTRPPFVTLTPTSGRQIIKNKQWYVAGIVGSELLVEDPSGINDTTRPPVFDASWVNQSGAVSSISDIIYKEDSRNNQFTQRYNFDFNTLNPTYSGIASFNMDVKAADSHGNDYGYSTDPHSSMYIIDNSAPTFVYEPPYPDLPSYDENTYLNLNSKQNLNFTVTDVVGDKLDVRQIVLSKGLVKRTLTEDNFYVNSTNQIVVSLCKSSVCPDASEKTVDLDDGEWSFALEGEDELGNKVKAQDIAAPKYVLNIDSSKPEVTTGAEDKFIGGNEEWNPNSIIGWGSLSAPKDIQVKLNRPGASWIDVVKCSVADGEACSDYPAYLTGVAPNYQIQLVAEHFTHGVNNQFKITAINDAYPSNTGEGTHTFKVDKEGPSILLANPSLTDKVSNGSHVMGRNFNINIAQITDDSDVESVSVYQEKTDGSRIAIQENTAVVTPENPFSIVLRNVDTDRIVLTPNSNLVDLVVKAQDQFGFTRFTNKIGMQFDIEGPTLSLTNYSPSEYYRSNFVFNLNALDLSLIGDTSSTGVNRDTVKFWVYTGSTPPVGDPGSKPKPDHPNDILLDSPTDANLKVEAQDIRGNTNSEIFNVKVNETAPVASLAMVYADDDTTVPNDIATLKKDVKLILTLEDKSGIASIVSSYQLQGTKGSTTLNFTKKSEVGDTTVWESLIKPNVDGTYAISIAATNNTKANNENELLKANISRSLMVQTEGVELAITYPIDFTSHISNKDVNVQFKKVNDGGLKSLECWVRENYSNDTPPIDTLYYAKYDEPTTPICNITVDKNFLDNPVLITRTIGANNAEKVQKFSFKMADVVAPYIKEQASGYRLKAADVTVDSSNVKKLQLNIDYIDVDSNIDLTKQPTLEKNGNTLSPLGCERSTSDDSLVRCTYKENYNQFINGIETTHFVKANGVKDKAGNAIQITPIDKSILQLIIPTGNFEADITSLVDNQYIDGKSIEFAFKVKLFDESRLEDMVVSLADTSYAFSDESDTIDYFSNSSVCADDATATCFTFNGLLPDDYAKDSVVIKLLAKDVWSKTAKDSLIVLLDNEAPTIEDTYQLSQSPIADKIRATFDLYDNISGSGLREVIYEVKAINFKEEKTSDFTFIDLDESQIEGLDRLTVVISATDNVGLKSTKTINLDLSKPELTLDFIGNSELQGNKIALKERLQDLTIKATSANSITMSNYTLKLVNSKGEIPVTGSFVGDTARGQFTFNDGQQGQYTLILLATDSIGRDITTYNYKGITFGDAGANSYVDFVAPMVGAVQGEQVTFLPNSGNYQYNVKSVVTDANLNDNRVRSTLKTGSQTYMPQSVTKPTGPTEPFIFYYLVPAGDYTATVTAEDYISQETSNTGVIKIAEATTPSLSITSSTNDLGSEAQSTITFTFTEDVIDFTKEDVVLSASDSGATGTLDMSTWAVGPAQSWSAIYTAPKGENKTVTISVAQGSYTSTITVPGNAATRDVAVKGVLPTVSNTVFNPIHADNLKTVEVKVDFSVGVSDVKATLLTAPVSWISGQNSDKWVGSVVVPASSDDQLILVVSEFTDSYGNVGEADNSGVLYLTPSITINPISGGVINENDASSVVISGTTTRFEAGKEITVEFSNSVDAKSDSVTATVGSDGSWTATGVNLSRWKDSAITVKARGSNQHNIAAEAVTETAQLSTAKPTLTSVVSNPTFGNTGDKIGVTANFSVAVSNATAKLGSSDVTWVSGQDTATWVGEVTIPNSSPMDTEWTYTVKGFSDTNGNLGDESTSGAVYLTPSITVDPILGGVINGSDITNGL
ncbi:Ig-like domain-containing protein [Aliivibrio fischeri]|uniref:Ig-like domain-containing protein n=1 Tax=Aliivibrio fischeri TaxID=668 RepID=UPI0007C4A7FD|nr:Ig-like domain-containing protein [Aliivibrio fischeri]